MEVVIDGIKHVPYRNIAYSSQFEQALSLEMPDNNDVRDGITIKEYLHELLAMLWSEKEGFDGKRPFGNSGWEYDIYRPLIVNGFIGGSLDEDGYIDHLTDANHAYHFVASLIDYIFLGTDKGTQ